MTINAATRKGDTMETLREILRAMADVLGTALDALEVL